MRDRRWLGIALLASFVGTFSFWVSGARQAEAWRFVPEDATFEYPGIESVGYLTLDDPQGIGRVVTTRAEKAVLIGQAEDVYLNVGRRQGVQVGDVLLVFSVDRPRELRDHRVVTIEGKLLVTEVGEAECAARVSESYRPISIGSRVIPFTKEYRDRLPSKFPMKPAPKSVAGRIIWSYEGLVSLGEGDLVFFDKGSADGVEVGQCYQVVRVPMEEAEASSSLSRKGGPAKDHLATAISEAVVLRVEKTTSTALLVRQGAIGYPGRSEEKMQAKSQLPVHAGDRFRAGCGWEAQAAAMAKERKAAQPKPAPAPGEGAEAEAFRKAAESFENVDVRFAYDSYTLSAEAQKILQEKARFLKSYPQVQVLIEGHCDERGTESYNLALGDRRAFICRNYLIGLGIAPERMKTVSFGKERPVDPGHNEDAWSKNRRAHFVIQAR